MEQNAKQQEADSIRSSKDQGMRSEKRSRIGIWIILAPFALLIAATLLWVLIYSFFGGFGNDGGAETAMSLRWINIAFGFIVGASIATAPVCVIVGIVLLVQKKHE